MFTLVSLFIIQKFSNTSLMETRIIPSLLLDSGKLFKGIQYKNHTYVGCPINAVKIFTEKEVDEVA